MINAFAPAQPRSLSPAWLAKECGSLSQRCPGLPQTFNAGHPRLLFADDLLRAGDQGGRGGIDRCDDLLRLGALGWAADRKIEPLRLGEELRILHRVIEGRPDDREPIGRHLLRRDDGPAERVRFDQDIENVLGLLAAGEIAYERNLRGEPWDPQRRELDHGVDLLVADPFRRHAAPGAAVAVQFAALDR